VQTPGKHTVEQVSTVLKVSPSKLIKTLLYDVDGGPVAVLVRGDHDVNAAKLARVLRQLPPEGGSSSGQSRAESRDVAGSRRVKLASVQTIERLSGAPMGFTGPVRLPGVRLLVDHAVMGIVNGVTGANQAETHLIHVNPGRDFQPSVVADLRMVTEEDPCPACGKRLGFVKAIEVGHVFKLGTTYSQAFGATVQDAAGAVQPMVMGCYGIGINRILAAAIEQHHDADGIVWPAALAPFHAVVSVMESANAEQRQAGEEAHDALARAGFDVLLDDREQSPGSKLKDADLVGIPVQVVVGKVWQRDRHLEVCLRASKEKTVAPPVALVETVQKLLDKASSS
jgi:prolyl-tRNA synthetase